MNLPHDDDSAKRHDDEAFSECNSVSSNSHYDQILILL